jgi:hypothetical protein
MYTMMINVPLEGPLAEGGLIFVLKSGSTGQNTKWLKVSSLFCASCKCLAVVCRLLASALNGQNTKWLKVSDHLIGILIVACATSCRYWWCAVQIDIGLCPSVTSASDMTESVSR